MKRFTKALKATTMAIAATAMVSTSAIATEGLFGNGTGARNKALAGAGVANEKDATAMSLNPAGLVHSENQLSLAASLFSPLRENEGAYNGAPGAVVESDRNYFVIPNLAYSHRVDGNTVFGLSVYGNGGMNSQYPYAKPAPNPFGGQGQLGVDLTQIFFSAGLAKSYGNISVGLAPIVAVQIVKFNGVGNGLGGNLSENIDIAAGVGLRGGVEVAVTDNFRIGVAAATPTYSQAFQSYKNDLLAVSDGVFDIPATIQAGIALDVTPTLTIMADYKRIFYSTSQAISTSTAAGGFGWEDINAYKFGVEWMASDGLTLRGGYSFNDQPIPASAAQLGILAPGVVTQHFTAGAMLKISDSMDFEVAGMYAPEDSVSGPFNTPFGAVPGGTTIRMAQWELTAGIKWKLGATEAPLK